MICFFEIDNACKEIFAISPRSLKDLFQSEDLVCGAATRTKTALTILIPLFLGISFQDIYILSLAN